MPQRSTAKGRAPNGGSVSCKRWLGRTSAVPFRKNTYNPVRNTQLPKILQRHSPSFRFCVSKETFGQPSLDALGEIAPTRNLPRKEEFRFHTEPFDAIMKGGAIANPGTVQPCVRCLMDERAGNFSSSDVRRVNISPSHDAQPLWPDPISCPIRLGARDENTSYVSAESAKPQWIMRENEL